MSEQADALNRTLKARGVLPPEGGIDSTMPPKASQTPSAEKPPSRKSAGVPRSKKPTIFDPSEHVEALNVFWLNGKERYFLLQPDPLPVLAVSESDLKRRLRLRNVRQTKIEDMAYSQQDEVIELIQRTRHVDYAGPLSGQRIGVVEVQGRRMLATSSYKLIEPSAGDWPIIRTVIGNLLTTEDADQTLFFYAWMKIGVEALRRGAPRPGHALILAGPRAAGKSFVQEHIITPLFGGRFADPLKFLLNKTAFNADMGSAEHLAIQEVPSALDHKSRGLFGEELKRLIATESHALHPKFCDAITFQPWWRVSISVNNTATCLKALPPLTADFGDKVLLLLCEGHEMPMPTTTLEERRLFVDALRAEFPAFINFLLEWQIPEAIKRTKHATRFGFDHFHHPELVGILFDQEPESKLLHILDNRHDIYPADGVWGWDSSDNLKEALLDEGPPRKEGDREGRYRRFAEMAREILHYHGSTGTLLQKLMTLFPERIFFKHNNKGNFWQVKAPESWISPNADPRGSELL